MAAFNLNLGNKMVMQSAALVKGRKGNRFQLEDYDEDGASGCFGKRKKSNKKLEKERIKQFSIWFEEVDNARQKEFAQRRFGRQYQRALQRKRVKCFRRFLLPTAILWLVGFVLILGSTVQSLGEGTIFWTRKEYFHIAGPVILGIGFIMLMVTEGFISHHQIKLQQLDSLMLTPQVSIEVNGKGHVHPIRTTTNSGQRTLKSISYKLKGSRNTERDNELNSADDHEQMINTNTHSFRPEVDKSMVATESNKQEYDTRQSSVSFANKSLSNRRICLVQISLAEDTRKKKYDTQRRN